MAFRVSNNPLPSSVVTHGVPSDSLSGGLQALILQNVEEYDTTLCTESYRKCGIPTPPLRDPTVQWLRQASGDKGYVFLQSVGTAMPFIPFEKCVSPNRLILTTRAYLKVLNIFWSARPHESEWFRQERQTQAALETMRNGCQTVSMGQYLSYMSHGSSSFVKPIEVYQHWTLMLEGYGESQWDKNTPLRLTLKYVPTGKNMEMLPAAVCVSGSNLICLSPHLMTQIATDQVMNWLKKNQSQGYFSVPTAPPAVTPPAATIDILAKATKEAKINRIKKNLKKCGLSDASSSSSNGSSSSDDEQQPKDNLDSYSLPVVATTTPSAGKVVKKTSNNKPYDRPATTK